MTNPKRLQEKLLSLLKGLPALRIMPYPDYPWSDKELDDAAWIVEDFVNQNPEVIEDDNRLKDWLDSYKFYRATRK